MPPPGPPTPVDPGPVDPAPVEPGAPAPAELAPVPADAGSTATPAPSDAPPSDLLGAPAGPPADLPVDPLGEVPAAPVAPPESSATVPAAAGATVTSAASGEHEALAEPGDDVPLATRRRGALPVLAAATAVALLAGAAGALGWQLRQQAQAETAREQGLVAARDAARLLFSYDHSTLDEDFAAGLAVTTGAFREEYSTTTQEVVTPVAEQYDAVVVAEVIEAAVIDAEPDEVIAMVFLNQATTSTRVEGQQVDQSRVRMRLVARDGLWLVEKVAAL